MCTPESVCRPNAEPPPDAMMGAADAPPAPLHVLGLVPTPAARYALHLAATPTGISTLKVVFGALGGLLKEVLSTD